jgi:hypothetical protein
MFPTLHNENQPMAHPQISPLENSSKILQIYPPKPLIPNTKIWWLITNMKNSEQFVSQPSIW